MPGVRRNEVEMSKRKYHLDEQDIPEGFQIFEDRLEVAGVRFRKEDAAAFASAPAYQLAAISLTREDSMHLPAK